MTMMLMRYMSGDHDAHEVCRWWIMGLMRCGGDDHDSHEVGVGDHDAHEVCW